MGSHCLMRETKAILRGELLSARVNVCAHVFCPGACVYDDDYHIMLAIELASV